MLDRFNSAFIGSTTAPRKSPADIYLHLLLQARTQLLSQHRCSKSGPFLYGPPIWQFWEWGSQNTRTWECHHYGIRKGYPILFSRNVTVSHQIIPRDAFGDAAERIFFQHRQHCACHDDCPYGSCNLSSTVSVPSLPTQLSSDPGCSELFPLTNHGKSWFWPWPSSNLAGTARTDHKLFLPETSQIIQIFRSLLRSCCHKNLVLPLGGSNGRPYGFVWK